MLSYNLRILKFAFQVCESGHEIKKWCSQPVLNMRLHAGDLHASAAILLSGNNYAKIALFAKALNVALPCASTFFRVQRKYLIPSVQEYYLQQQTSILLDSKDKDLVIRGRSNTMILIEFF